MLYRCPSIRLSIGLAFSYFPLETRETLYPLIYVLPIPFYELRYLFPVSSIYFFDTGIQNTALFSSFHFYYENFFHLSLSEEWVTFQYLFITEDPQQPSPKFHRI